jgi:hypothetical protein
MKLKLWTLLIIAVAFSFHVIAQSNYQSGYVIKSTGDTVKGFINYKEWVNSPQFIDFKTTETQGKANRFTPDMLQSFEVTGKEKYTSYSGKLSADKNNYPDLPSQLDTTIIQDTVFLHLIYNGSKISLLQQQDNLKTRLFYQERNEKPVELKFYQYLTDGNKVYPYEPFKRQLFALANKYQAYGKKMDEVISTASFDENSLIKLIKLINQDTNKKKNISTYGGRFFAGITFNRTATQFNGTNRFANQPFTSYIPRLAVGYDLFANKYTQKVFLKSELSFTYVSPSFNAGSELTSNIASYQFTQLTASLGMSVIYNFYNANRIKVFIGAGISVNGSKYTKNEFNQLSFPQTTNNYYSLESAWATFPIQAGVTINKKVDVFATYISPSSYANYIAFSVSNRVYGVGVRYLFGSK